MSGITASTLPWYISRATGVVSLVLLTAVMVIGILINRQGRLPGLPRFAVTNLHRNLSLMAVVFIVIHVVTAVLDGYVSIPLISGVIPFTSGYEGFWLGLGAISSDLMLALIVTSLIRGRLSRRVWKAVHWLAYASWPVAFAHSIGSSSDLQGGLLLGLAVLCAAALAAALTWRLVTAARTVPRSERVSAVLAAASERRLEKADRR
ncbi:MAG TPA: ferric reductase-like transmembrane domain-containing protein [Streptosporangiaceae bacterium]|jgi:predicted ferric reductase|nr:ferric reductase-like transmembrane domain-containing protein [Streptosporangiaceae bacterium]